MFLQDLWSSELRFEVDVNCIQWTLECPTILLFQPDIFVNLILCHSWAVPSSSWSKAETSVVWFFDFSKNHWFRVFQKLRVEEALVPGAWKTTESKNYRFCVFQYRQFSWKTSRFLSRLFPGSLNLVIFSQAVARVGTRKILFDESVGGWLFLNLASVGYMSKNRHWIQEPPNTGTNKSCNTLSFQCSH
jgi:hypothetical protein